MKALKRLLVKIPLSLDNQISQNSRARGQTKAAFIRECLTSTDMAAEIKISKYRKEPTVSYTLRLSSPEFTYLQNLSKKTRAHVSEIVRSIISTPQQPSEQTAMKSKELMLKLEKLWGQVSSGDLVAAELSFGELEQLLLGHSSEDWPYAYISLARGLFARHVRNLRLAERMFHLSIELAQKHNLTDVMMESFSQLGVLADIGGQVWQAVSYNLQAQQIAESQHNVDEEIRILLRLANLAGYQLLDAHSKGYAEAALAKSDKDKIRILNRLAVSHIRLGDFTGAESLLAASAEELNKNSGQKITETRYWTENTAVCALAKGDLQGAREMFSRAIELEKLLRQPELLGKAKLYKLFIQSEYNFESNWKQMQLLVEHQHQPAYADLGQYVLYSSEYIHGDQGKSLAGRQKLQSLAARSGNPMIAAAAIHTIKSQKIRPII